MRRLYMTGMVKRVKARVSPVDEPFLDQEDPEAVVEPDAEGEEYVERLEAEHVSTPMKRRTRQPAKVRWVRCVKLMREPEERDKAAFVSNAAAERGIEEDKDDSEPEPADDDLEEVDADEETLPTVTKFGELGAETKQRIPPQWHPGMHHTQFVFNLVQSCGTAGISTMDLTDRAMGHLWRRPLDELLGRLTDVWRVSQPPHLRHLSVIRDTAFLNRASHYQFRTFNNFKKLVDEGAVTWEAIGQKAAQIENEIPDLDQWGFPRVKPSSMLGPHGTANMTACKASVDKPHHRRTHDPSRASRSLKLRHQSTVPSTPVATPAISLNIARMDPPSTTTRPRGGRQQSLLRTPKVAGTKGSPDICTSTPAHSKFKMKPQRVEAERLEWEARAKRLARALALAEANPCLAAPVQHESEPPKKKRRGRPRKTPAADDLTHVDEQDSRTIVPVAPRESRAGEIEATILAMAEPRIYINPPGAGQSKMTIIQPTGRPSKYLIAVCKSPRLKEFGWFGQAEQIHPLLSKERISARRGSVQSTDADDSIMASVTEPDAPVSHSAIDAASSPTSEKVPRLKTDFTIVGGRKRRSQVSLREHIIKRQARIGPQDQPTFTPINETAAAETPAHDTHHIPNGHSLHAGEAASSKRPRSSVAEAHTSIVSDRSMDDVDASMADASTDQDFRPDATQVDSHSRVNGVEDSNVEPSLAEILAGQARQTPISTIEEHKTSELVDSESNIDTTQVEASLSPHKAVPSVEQEMEGKRRMHTPRGKVGVPRSGGITKHQREMTVLAIVHRYGGMFGGDKELHFPFITEWEKVHGQRPDRHTFDRVLRTLVTDRKLNKVPFTFKAPNGSFVTKHVVTEPDMDTGSEAVKQLQRKIIAMYPHPYLPPEVELAPDLRARVFFEPQPPNKRPYQLTVRDTFLEDDSAFINRLHPPRPRPVPVKLGMTEAKLERDMASRRRKREQEQKRQERYLRAQQEEEIEEASSALQTDFQLDAYAHDPDRARVNRGPKGRSRLSKLQRWDDMGRSSHRKALGLLGAAKKQQEGEKPDENPLDVANAPLRRRRRRRRSTNGTLLPLDEESPAPYEHNFAVPSWAGPRRGFSSYASGTGAQSGFGPSIVEMFTLITPYQRFHQTSGTFSTDPVVVASVGKPAWIGKTGHVAIANEQLSMQLADIFRQADSSQAVSADLASRSTFPRMSTPLSSFVSDVIPHTRHKEDGLAPYSTNATFRVLDAGKIPRKGSKAPSSALQRIARSTPASKTPLRRDVAPRASRSGIFTMTKAEEERLVIAFVVAKTLAGGLEQVPNWGIVHQIFHFKFDANYCRNRWANIRGKHAATADKLQSKFQELFIEAYEKGELPAIDFMEPEKYDWISLVEWAEARLGTQQSESTSKDIPDLPADRSMLDRNYEIKLPDDVYGIGKEDYWNPHVTLVRRDELVRDWTHTVVEDESAEMSDEKDPLMLAKSWVRANILTSEEEFDGIAAGEKLVQLDQNDLTNAIQALLGAKIIRMENKGRQIPGRNYDISDTVLATFKRTWDANHLRQVANHKLQVLDPAFADVGGKVDLPYTAPDHEMLGITNLVANGYSKVIPNLPPINHDFDAPWPRLTKWGFTDGNYKTVQLDKERLHFGLSIVPTDKYIQGNPTRSATVPPPLEYQVPGEKGARLPLWTDINGHIIPSVWDMMVMATLHLLVFRPAMSPATLTSAYKGKLWEWEIRLFLRWGEEAGLLKRVVVTEGEEAARDDVGWTTTDWWWLVFADGPAEGGEQIGAEAAAGPGAEGEDVTMGEVE